MLINVKANKDIYFFKSPDIFRSSEYKKNEIIIYYLYDCCTYCRLYILSLIRKCLKMTSTVSINKDFCKQSKEASSNVPTHLHTKEYLVFLNQHGNGMKMQHVKLPVNLTYSLLKQTLNMGTCLCEKTQQLRFQSRWYLS